MTCKTRKTVNRLERKHRRLLREQLHFKNDHRIAPIGSSVISTCSLADLFEERERNVPLASADVRGRGILRDEPKERLRRRLADWLAGRRIDRLSDWLNSTD